MSENVFNDSTLFDNGAPEVGNEVELAGDPPQEDATKATVGDGKIMGERSQVLRLAEEFPPCYF